MFCCTAFMNDETESLKVSEGCSAILYEDGDFVSTDLPFACRALHNKDTLLHITHYIIRTLCVESTT